MSNSMNDLPSPGASWTEEQIERAAGAYEQAMMDADVGYARVWYIPTGIKAMRAALTTLSRSEAGAPSREAIARIIEPQIATLPRINLYADIFEGAYEKADEIRALYPTPPAPAGLASRKVLRPHELHEAVWGIVFDLVKPESIEEYGAVHHAKAKLLALLSQPPAAAAQ